MCSGDFLSKDADEAWQYLDSFIQTHKHGKLRELLKEMNL